MIHHIHSNLVSRRDEIKVVLVGAGGTGSHVLGGLATIHHAMLELDYPFGLDVVVIDPDTVSASNIGRQKFAPADIGLPKASVLVNRCNMTMRTDWQASVSRVDGDSRLEADIIIGCVDNRKARAAIIKSVSKSVYFQKRTYYLDIGNREHDGQVVLGEILPKGTKNTPDRLPHIADLYPEIIDASLDDIDDGPSCSLAEALEKQSLFINMTMANTAMSILWNLLRYGQIEHHGQFVNIKSGRSTPLAVDPEAWKRFGYKLPKVRATRQKKKSA